MMEQEDKIFNNCSQLHSSKIRYWEWQEASRNKWSFLHSQIQLKTQLPCGSLLSSQMLLSNSWDVPMIVNLHYLISVSPVNGLDLVCPVHFLFCDTNSSATVRSRHSRWRKVNYNNNLSHCFSCSLDAEGKTLLYLKQKWKISFPRESHQLYFA